MLAKLSKQYLTTDKENFDVLMTKFIESMSNLPQKEIKTISTLKGGLYIREMYIPQGCCIIGAPHKTETVAIISSGVIKIFTEHGLTTMKGHRLVCTPPGMQRAGFALTDVVFTTIHRTDCTEVSDAVAEVIEGGEAVLLGGKNNIQVRKNKEIADAEYKSVGEKHNIAGLL